PYLWPALVRRRSHLLSIGGKGVPRLGGIEQVKALARDDPKSRVAGYRHPARHPHRIVAAEARHVDVGIEGKGCPVGLAVEAPDPPAMGQLEGVLSRNSLAVDEVGDRVEA